MRCRIFEPTCATFGEICMCHMEDIYLVFYLVDVVSTLGCSHVPHGAFIALDGMTYPWWLHVWHKLSYLAQLLRYSWEVLSLGGVWGVSWSHTCHIWGTLLASLLAHPFWGVHPPFWGGHWHKSWGFGWLIDFLSRYLGGLLTWWHGPPLIHRMHPTLCYFWRLLHNKLYYFIIVDLSHGVGYLRELLYCFPWIFYCFFLEKNMDLVTPPCLGVTWGDHVSWPTMKTVILMTMINMPTHGSPTTPLKCLFYFGSIKLITVFGRW